MSLRNLEGAVSRFVPQSLSCLIYESSGCQQTRYSQKPDKLPKLSSDRLDTQQISVTWSLQIYR